MSGSSLSSSSAATERAVCSSRAPLANSGARLGLLSGPRGVDLVFVYCLGSVSASQVVSCVSSWTGFPASCVSRTGVLVLARRNLLCASAGECGWAWEAAPPPSVPFWSLATLSGCCVSERKCEGRVIQRPVSAPMQICPVCPVCACFSCSPLPANTRVFVCRMTRPHMLLAQCALKKPTSSCGDAASSPVYVLKL